MDSGSREWEPVRGTRGTVTPNIDTILGEATRLSAVVLRPAGGVLSFGLRNAQRGALGTLDALLRSRFADDAVQRVLASPLPETAAREVVRQRVLERVAERLVDEPELARMVQAALDSQELEDLAGRVIDSKLLDKVVVRLLESEELWLLVDEIAHSPAVTDAISSQSASFADEIAGRVRASTRTADAWLETKARRAMRRRAVR